MANLLHLKASRTKVLNTLPKNNFGKDGDIVLSKTSKGTYLCTKVDGRWYASNELNVLERIHKPRAKNLKSRNINITSMQKSSNDSGKFVILDNQRLKYRTPSEIANDLNLDLQNLSVNYKTAYCSLGQYSNKKDCEANNGTWYYSENESHDSLSNTAENQLLTIGSEPGNIDVEPTLLYDGSTLEIKRNTDFDDNWQTSTQIDLLKLSYDSSNYTAIKVGAAGATTISTVDADAGAAHLTLDADGRIHLDSETGYVHFYKAGDTVDKVSLRTIEGGEGVLSTNNAAGTAGHFTLDIDGNIFLEPAGGSVRIEHNGTNYFNTQLAANGVTTMTTVDSDGTVGHLTLAPNGDLILDPDSQKTIINATDALYFDGGTHTYITESSDDTLRFHIGGTTLVEMVESVANGVFVKNSNLVLDAGKKIIFDGSGVGHTSIAQSTADVMTFIVGGDSMLALDEDNDKITIGATNWVAGTVSGATITEFSVANSAYAGMILGIRVLGHDAGRIMYTFTNAFVTLHANATVRFIAPPSGVVEVYVQAGLLDALSGRYIYFGLSDNATYNTIGAEHEELINLTDESDQQIIQNTWVISGLTAGDTYNYWFGLKASLASSGSLSYGGTGSGHYSPFIMKVTALPAATADFAVYD